MVLELQFVKLFRYRLFIWAWRQALSVLFWLNNFFRRQLIFEIRLDFVSWVYKTYDSRPHCLLLNWVYLDVSMYNTRTVSSVSVLFFMVRIFVFVLSPVNQDIFSTGCLTANKRDHRDHRQTIPIVCPSRLFSGPIPPRPLFSIFLKSSSIPKSAALAGLCVSTMIELSALPFPGPCGPMWEYGWPIMLSQPGKETAKGKRQPLETRARVAHSQQSSETTVPLLPIPSRAWCHSQISQADPRCPYFYGLILPGCWARFWQSNKQKNVYPNST